MSTSEISSGVSRRARWLVWFVLATNVLLGADRPNIVFVLADDLGYGDLSCYGSRFIATPNIDRLAREGTRFTSAYSGSPVCAPSRNVLMTGRHTGHTRIRDNSPIVGGELEPYDGGREGGKRVSLARDDLTVATLLKRAGYATGITGKWGLGEEGTDGVPTLHGFDEWLGYLNQNHAAYYYTSYLDATRGRQPIPQNANGARRVYSNDLMADFMIGFLRRHRDGPFFLYLPFTLPHEQMEVPDLGAYADKPWPEDAKIYAAMVTRLDGYVGRLMRELEQLGLAKNTLVIFASDNGPVARQRSDFLESSGGLRGRKGTIFEGGLRVPAIARWPGHVPAGRTSDEPWYFADFLPTCVELAGVRANGNFDGISIAGLLTGKTQLPERTLYWEYPEDRLYQAARSGRWKALRFGGDRPIELYDLAKDRGETKNVAAEHPEIVARLRRDLDAAHVPSPHWPVN